MTGVGVGVGVKLAWEPQAETSHAAKCRERFGLPPREALAEALQKAKAGWLGPNPAPSAQGTLALVLKVGGQHVLAPVFIPGLGAAANPTPALLGAALEALRRRGGFVRSLFPADQPPGGGAWEGWKAQAVKLR